MRRGGGQLRCDKKTATFAAVFFVAFYVLVLRNVGGTGLHTVRPLMPHTAAPAPPAPTPVRTVGNITGGTSPLDKGTCQAPAPPVGDLRGMAQPTIHVFVPNFYNDALVVSNIRNMQARQRTPDVIYTVVTMEDTKEERDHAAAVIQNSVPNVYVLDLAQPRVAGGSALPAFFNFVLSRSRFEITVFADTDAFVLATGWDDMLEQMFADPDMGLAAINPRSASDEFADNAEWNWMALRTRQFSPGSCFEPVDGQRGFHDWGHMFSHHVRRLGMRQYFWPFARTLVKGAIVVGDSLNRAFAVHTFYASRRNKELNVTEHKAWIMDDQEFEALQVWVAGDDHSTSHYERILARIRH